MRHNPEKGDDTQSASADAKVTTGSQALLRGLDVLEGVAERPLALAELATKLGLTRSTTHRLANSLIDRRYLVHVPNQGYQLGPKLLELGFLAQQQTDIVQLARPWLQALSQHSEDTVHLGIRDGDRALYLDKIQGQRRISIRSRVGDRHPLTSTGLGKALLLDKKPEEWEQLFQSEQGMKAGGAYSTWLSRMQAYVERGRSYDLEENEDQIRCVAAPIRDVTGAIVAAISVSSAAQYMDDDRMDRLSDEVVEIATSISRDLGWQANDGTPPISPKSKLVRR